MRSAIVVVAVLAVLVMTAKRKEQGGGGLKSYPRDPGRAFAFLRG